MQVRSEAKVKTGSVATLYSHDEQKSIPELPSTWMSDSYSRSRLDPVPPAKNRSLGGKVCFLPQLSSSLAGQRACTHVHTV